MQLLDITQLSKMLNVKPKTIYDWVHKEQIPYVKLNHLLRFNIDAIQKWINKDKRRRH
ncbi:MAG: helix-turn-helix domain-containing protein [bacterium]